MGAGETIRIGLIGFGEVGQTFARGFALRPETELRAFDILFGSPAGARIEAAIAVIGVSKCNDHRAAIASADVVISAVTASQALAVAEEAAPLLAPGQLFLDVNSAAPSTKIAASRHIEGAGADYIECAVMAPVLAPGLAVPILAGGPQAERAATLLNPFGMNISPVSATFGRASAMKLCRSIIIKGLEALMVDCAEASARAGVADEVYASLGATFPSINWPQLAEAMRERVARHGARRAAEMREAGEMLADLGLDPSLALAVADAQARGASGAGTAKGAGAVAA